MTTEMANGAMEQVAAHAPSKTEYIVHHLTHLRSTQQAGFIDFHTINMDTVFWSIAMGIMAFFLMWAAARRVTSGVPGRFQAAVETLVEFVEDQSKSIVHGDRTFIAPLALSVFVWVLLMNSLDFIPVDWVGGLNGLFEALHLHFEIPHHRMVPTADLNGTLGIALGVLALTLYYNVKIKGVGGFIHELFCAPFGSHPALWIFNFGLNMIEFVAKTVSLGMRLFGNMYAGELLFLLIALLGSTATWWGFGMHIFAGTAWALFHLLIVPLQAFIFMMLTLVYIGQAHESH